MEISPNNAAVIKNAIETGKMSLLLGAGFTRGVLNAKGQPIPDGNQLKDKLWKLVGIEGEHSEDTLQIVYQLALGKVPLETLRKFLHDEFHVKSVPEWMKILPTFMWRKIITTNIDNAIEVAFESSKGHQRLRSVDGMRHDYVERDTTYSELLKIALHGSLDGIPKDVTFGTLQYAGRSNLRWEPWYNDFIYEYCNYPMIIVGSQLEEPLLWQYISAREERYKEELRPRSFLISPSLSPARKAFLEEYKITHIETTGEAFFSWLDKHVNPRPQKIDVLKAAAPHILPSMHAETKGESPEIVKAVTAFFKCFHVAERLTKDAGYRTTVFHGGAIPTWQDIAHDLDARRDKTQDLLDSVSVGASKGGTKTTIVYGPAGSGKSTIARRFAWSLVGNSQQVLFNESGQFPPVSVVRDTFSFLGGRPVVIIDDAHKSYNDAIRFASKVHELGISAHIVMFVRSVVSGSFIDELEQAGVKVEESPMDELSREEIDSVIGVLEKTGMLGRLQGLSQDARVKEFEIRAKKQLLVAMKEATNGQGFDEIIKTEYATLEPVEVKKMYLMASLVTAHNHSISKSVLVGAFGVPPGQSLAYLKRELRNLVVEVDVNAERFIARHQVIAETTIDKAADRDELLECYLELLARLVPTLGSADRKSRPFRLYKSIIGHDKILLRFGRSNLEYGRRIYDGVKATMQKDHHFWLQYANFELECRSLSLAQTYIDAAESLCSDDPYVILTKTKIGMHRAVESRDLIASKKLFDECIKDLLSLIDGGNSNDAYPYHVYASSLRIWAYEKESEQGVRFSLVEEAERMVNKGLKRNPRDKRLTELLEQLRADKYYIGANTWSPTIKI